MFRIVTTDGTLVGYTDKIAYVRYSDTGTLIPATASEAIGIAHKSIPYNLVGHDEIDGAKTAVVFEEDIGDVVDRAVQSIADMDYFAMMAGIQMHSHAVAKEEE